MFINFGDSVSQLQTCLIQYNDACYNATMGKKSQITTLITAILLFAGLARVCAPVQAQNTLTLRVSQIITDSFPTISFFTSVNDAAGNRFSGLKAENFSISENATSISGFSVQEVQVGTRQIFAINTSLAIGLRDGLGYTRYDYIFQALLDWWQNPQVTQLGIDDLNLITADMPLVTHSESAAELGSQLAEFIPEYNLETEPIQLLHQALVLASDPTPRPGMPDYVIFITPLIRAPETTDWQNVVDLALETETRIFTVLLADTEDLQNPVVQTLTEMSQLTGGDLILFQPEEGLDSLSALILSNQNQYRIEYRSLANTSGSQNLELTVRVDGMEESSPILTYQVEIQPPYVQWVEIPGVITRKIEDTTLPLVEAFPSEMPLQIQISFPDGHPRSISSTSLFIDNSIAQRNNTPPYDSVIWDISELTMDIEHQIRIEVEDSLGLSGSTTSQSVNIIIDRPPSGLAAMQPALSTLLLALGILAVALLGGFRFAHWVRTSSKKQVPLSPEQQMSENSKPGVRLSSRARTTHQLKDNQPEAALISLQSGNATIELIGIDHNIGRDATVSSIVLDDPSIERLQARLIRLADGRYSLRNASSATGTWINYQPVSESGMILHHGDLVHFGRIGLRFLLSSPPQPNNIYIEYTQNKQDKQLETEE